MDNHIAKFLNDILEAINKIELFIGPVKRYDHYLSDLMLKSSVERQIQIVGEAVVKLKKLDPEIKISQINNIIKTRNILVHAYDAVNDTIIWAIVINELPKLKIEVELLLDEY